MSGQRASGQVWAFARLPALIPCRTRQPGGQRALLRFARHSLKSLVALGRATGNGHPLKGDRANCPPPRCGAHAETHLVGEGIRGGSKVGLRNSISQGPTLSNAVVGGYPHRQQPIPYSYLLSTYAYTCHTTYHKQHIYTQVAG